METRGTTAAGTAAVLLSGDGAGTGGGHWWWLVTAVGVVAAFAAGYVLGRRGRPAPEDQEAGARGPVVLDKRDGRPEDRGGRVPGDGRAWGPVGPEAWVRPAVLNAHDRKPAGGRRGVPDGAVLPLALLGLAAFLAVLWVVWPDAEDFAPDLDSVPTAAAPPSRTSPPAIAWEAPPARVEEEEPGAWALRDAVVQVRLDGLTAYGASDGKARWTLSAPAREAVCRMSPRAGQDVGLIAYGRHGKPCATVVAVHTGTGRALWKRPVGGQGVYGVAVGGPVAVIAEGSVVLGRNAESGAARWEHPMRDSCAVLAVDADPTRTLLVERCDDKSARLTALDTATGEERWTRVLDVASDLTASVVSVTPAVVAVEEEDERGTHALLAYDDAGRPTATVPLVGPAGTIDPFAHRPVVTGGRLVVPVEESSSVAVEVAAYALDGGRKLWSHRYDRMLKAVAAEPDGSVGALTYGGNVVVLDAATGKKQRWLGPEQKPGEQKVSIYPDLYVVAGDHVVVNRISMAGEPALFAIR
ncbi:PQQ-binding-like beta-propeller repeat protein [Streptomyces sp. NPDC051909]|uniref:outer membrane protein assembly factor BamB family protein n=1 Tax=Streptomyces sp. NPDC051909 TaxID=3154944 RepID=UPI00343AF1F1